MCFQCALKLSVVAWYQANKTYVATVLCENKAQPQKKCNGKCYLRKQLNKTEAPGNNNTEHKTHPVEMVDFLPAQNISIALHYYSTLHIFFDRYAAPMGYQPIAAIFHPPPVACLFC